MVQLAVKTMAAIEEAVRRDQGNAYRVWLGRVIPHIGDAYRHDDDQFRSHMGASTIGRECAREIWYSFRWATAKRAEGRMVRLWNRGHLEEARFIALLLTIGCEVFQQDENGKQYRISDAGGHFGGSGDGMFRGCPDLPPDTMALSEFKTHNDKSFQKLKSEGVRSAKFEHFVQMQVYMLKMGLAVAVYFAVNKNDDEIYAEVVPRDTAVGEQFVQRGLKIIPLRQPPDKLSTSPGFYKCKFCDHRPVCQLGAPPERNCRTCQHSVANTDDGKWYCTHPDLSQPVELSKSQQAKACGMWSKNPLAFS